MKKLAIFSFVLVLFLMVNQSHALTNNDLYKVCTSNQDDAKSLCQTYVTGVYEAVLFGDVFLNGGNKDYCVPEDYNPGKLYDTYMGFLKNNPGYLERNSAVTMIYLLKENYSCK